MATDLGDRVQLWRFGLEVRADRACPLQEHANGGFARERLEWELLLAADAQPRPTRHDDLQVGARSDNGRDGRRCIDDLLEVVEDEQKAAALDVRDETLLEVTLAVEQPERAGDRADDVSGVPHRLERHDDDAVRVVIGNDRGNRVRKTSLPDPSRPGDGEQPNVGSA